MAGFRLFGQTLTSETFASAGALFSASDLKISLNGDAEKTTLPFHSLRAKANPSGEMFPTNGDGCVQELQLLPTGEVSGNTDTHSRSGGKESMLRSGHTASQSEGSAGQPAATFLSMSSTPAAASSLPAQPSQGAPLSVDHKHEPRSSKGLVKIKVKAPRLQPSQNFQEEPLAKKPKVVIMNRRLNMHRKEEVEKEPVKSHLRPDAPQVQDSELLGQDNKEPNRQKTIAKSVSGSSHIEALPPTNGCTIRDEDVHAGQSEPHDINILTHKERQGRDTLLHIEEETKADRESNEDANAEKKEEEKEERKQDLKGRVATPPPGIIFRRGEDRPRLQVLGCGLGMRWKEATNRGSNSPTTPVTGKVRIVISPRQPLLPHREVEEELDLKRSLCMWGMDLLAEIGDKGYVKELQNFFDGLWTGAAKIWPGTSASPRYGTIVERFKVNRDEGYLLVELSNQEVADEVVQMLRQAKFHVFLGNPVQISPVLTMST